MNNKKIPEPEVGMVISYSYLWRYEDESGISEGRKNRPCVIVLSIRKENNEDVVSVVPITHTQPKDNSTAVEIPIKVKKYLGLDNEKSWIILDELNEFTWPGYDLKMVSESKFIYGFLPPKLFDITRTSILDLIIKRRAIKTTRD